MQMSRVKKMVILGMFAALAFAMLVFRVPVVLFLKYEPKDIIITISGFLFGPLSAFAVSAVVCTLEMVTISDTGFIGLIMNLMSSALFACTAAYIYKKKPTIRGAVIGLITGALAMTAMMLLWNYFVTPIYMKLSREAVSALLVPFILPFNLLKSGLNAGLTLLLYKPLVGAMRKSGLLPPSQAGIGKGKVNVGVMLAAGLVLITCVMFVLVLQGVL